MAPKPATGWSPEEDNLLRVAVIQHGGKKWRAIAAAIPLRSPVQCNARWNELQSLHTAVKTPWTPHEDERMAQLVTSYGPGRWAVIASFLPGRNGKQCRERWHNQLNPSINKESWTADEDRTIVELQAKFGNAWAKIAHRLDGRTDNAVKNRWHSSLLKSNTRRSVRKKRSHASNSSGPRPRKLLKAKKQPSRVVAKHSRGGDVTSPDAVDAERLCMAVRPLLPAAASVLEVKSEQPTWDEGVAGIKGVTTDVLHQFPPSDGTESPLMMLLAGDDDDDDVDDERVDAVEAGSFSKLLHSSDDGLTGSEPASRRHVATDDFAIDDAFRPSAGGVDTLAAVSGLAAAGFDVAPLSLNCKIEPRLTQRVRFDDDDDDELKDDDASRVLYHSVWKGSEPAVAVAPLALPDALFSGGYSFPMPASHEDAAGFLFPLGGGDILL